MFPRPTSCAGKTAQYGRNGCGKQHESYSEEAPFPVDGQIGHRAGRMASALGEQLRAPRTWDNARSRGHAEHQCR
jgi:hypothetical protein